MIHILCQMSPLLLIYMGFKVGLSISPYLSGFQQTHAPYCLIGEIVKWANKKKLKIDNNYDNTSQNKN